MGYMSMGDISSDNFNSTKYPGVCKPSNVSTLATFKRMQTQMNRVAAVKGFKTIAIDGDVGPGTLGLFKMVQAFIVQHALDNGDFAAASKISSAPSSSCTAVAMIADVIANEADSLASELNAPANPPAPQPTKPPVLVSSTGIETKVPAGASLLTAWESAPAATKYLALAVLGGIGYFTLVKKPRRKSGYRRNPARRRRKKARRRAGQRSRKSASQHWSEYLDHVQAGRRKAAERALDRYDRATRGRR